MRNDDFTPDLTRLEHDYQILTELHRSHHSRTYLARHLGLNRDVTITVVCAADGSDNSALAQFASDARVLTTTRHPNVVPVIEGRWLGVDTLAVVRARVRGTTLDQALPTGRMPAPRVADTLAHIHGALEWARKHEITHRHVSPDNVIFQQGSGRVLLSFDPALAAADMADDRCADARTIGRLAWEMLSGQRADAGMSKSLSELRPELDPRIAVETTALMSCRRDGAVPDVAAFIATLFGADAPVVVESPEVMKAPSVLLPGVPRQVSSRVNTDEPVVVVNRGMTFNARMGAAVAVIAIIGVMGLMLVRRNGSTVETPAMTAQVADSLSEAAGDVALRSRVDTSRFIVPPRQPSQQPMPINAQPALTQPVSPTATSAAATTPVAPTPAETPRQTPVRPTDSVPTVSIRPTVARPLPRDSVANVEKTGEMCDSPAGSDQHACLLDAIEKNDTELNRVYRRVIASLRRQANVQEGADDPPSVVELRSAQNKWLEERDVACRNVGDGPLYARDRSQCFAEQSVKRTDELRKKIPQSP